MRVSALTSARRATWLFLLTAAALGVAALLFRVVLPDLVDAHDDVLAAVGVAAALGGLILLGWMILGIVFLALRFITDLLEDRPHAP